MIHDLITRAGFSPTRQVDQLHTKRSECQTPVDSHLLSRLQKVSPPDASQIKGNEVFFKNDVYLKPIIENDKLLGPHPSLLDGLNTKDLTFRIR